MLVFDFEVFSKDWLMVALDLEKKEVVTVINDRDHLRLLYGEHQDDVWVGYNVRHYDQYILKGIVTGHDPKLVNDFIIRDGNPGWSYSEDFRACPLIFFDVMPSYDRSLKQLEGFMGDDICESEVPFDIPRKLTRCELEEVVEYCTHDVFETAKVFGHVKADYLAQVELLKMFKLKRNKLSLTKAQIAAEILHARKQDYFDEFDIYLPDTLDIQKYTDVPEWYTDKNNRHYRSANGRHQIITQVSGVDMAFGWGGVHGARPRYHASGLFVNMDVASMYPALMIEYGLGSRSCDFGKFVEIRDRRLELKRDKDPREAALKIVINAAYGAMKDKYNRLYDPRQNNLVCVFGQLLLLDLIEKIEHLGELVQANTDGVLIRLYDESGFDELDDIAFEWEKRTRLSLEFDTFCEVWQKDVNNYLMLAEDGTYKCKGAWLKKPTPLDAELPIVGRAIREYLVNKTPVTETIYGSNDLWEFQIICRATSKFKGLLYGGSPLTGRTARVFAARTGEGLPISKVTNEGRIVKCEGSPQSCFVFNHSVSGEPVPDFVNREWYVGLARQRISELLPEQKLF
jgi:DNA polymerase